LANTPDAVLAEAEVLETPTVSPEAGEPELAVPQSVVKSGIAPLAPKIPAARPHWLFSNTSLSSRAWAETPEGGTTNTPSPPLSVTFVFATTRLLFGVLDASVTPLWPKPKIWLFSIRRLPPAMRSTPVVPEPLNPLIRRLRRIT
jgi:hypothetical protein